VDLDDLNYQHKFDDYESRDSSKQDNRDIKAQDKQDNPTNVKTHSKGEEEKPL
jgi:hypothetical protein